MQFTFKENDFETRLAEGEKMKRDHVDRVAVIVEKSFTSRLNNLDKKTFPVPMDLTVRQFYALIRKCLSLRPEDALYFFVNNKVVRPKNTSMRQLYADHHEADLFLYITYTDECPEGGKHNCCNLL